MLEESHATHRDGGSGRKLPPRQDIPPLPCPLPVLGSLPWSLGWVLQAHPLGCACYVCVGRTCPAGAVNSFSPCGPNLPHLSLCPFKLLAATPFAETVAGSPTGLPGPSLSPPDSQVFAAPCVQEENPQGEIGFCDIVLSPVCPASSPAPSWPPEALSLPPPIL